MATSKRLSTGMLPPSAGDVLLVEDDPQLRETALEILSLGGLLAAAVANGDEALKFLSAESPTLILLDLRMPVMDGWEFLRRRAASQTLSEVPVVILSGEPPDPTLSQSVLGWIAKPFTDDQLLNAVTEELRRIHERRQPRPAQKRRRR